MSSIHTIEVLAAISSYIEINNRPCPANYLTQKFGDDVGEIISNLKSESKIISRRGRNGGVMFPDTTFSDKGVDLSSQINAVPVQDVEASEEMSTNDNINTDGMFEDIPESVEDELSQSSY